MSDNDEPVLLVDVPELLQQMCEAKTDKERKSAFGSLVRLGSLGVPAFVAIVNRQRKENAALLAEVAALREALTLTPERVEAAAKAGYDRFFDIGDWSDNPNNIEHALWREVGKAALLAAGMREQEAQP